MRALNETEVRQLKEFEGYRDWYLKGSAQEQKTWIVTKSGVWSLEEVKDILTRGITMNDVKNDTVAAEQILGIPQTQGLPTKDTSVFAEERGVYTQSQEQVGDESEVAA